MTIPKVDGASFRDPAGFVYEIGGVVYRQVNGSYRPHYEALMQSGLYRALTDRGWLVPHDEVNPAPTAWRTIRPEPIPYVSYPSEWCLSQLRDAALLTLDIQQVSLAHGLTLKDASAYNVQFRGSRPVFIDTLSFERYHEGAPWVAYRQFCQHFLAPLALMARADVRLHRLMTGFIDGVPLDLASRLLPRTSWLRPGLAAHIHLHARSQQRHGQDGRRGDAPRTFEVSKSRLVALVDSLRRTVSGCRMRHVATEWGDYYGDTNYTADAMAAKERLVAGLVGAVSPIGERVHDLGANTGRFSRVVAATGREVVAHDIDELAVERHYRHNVAQGIEHVLPLVLDLTNPTPSYGWASDERRSAINRIENHTVLALALIHHLAISNNVPLAQLAEFFAGIARSLVIEFVPVEDSQVQRLLATRPDAGRDYTATAFESAFEAHFTIVRREPVPGTVRVLYAMRRIGPNEGPDGVAQAVPDRLQ